MTMELLKVAFLFAVPPVAQIVGCDLPWLVVKPDKSAWLLLPTACFLALFAWLLALRPTAGGRGIWGRICPYILLFTGPKPDTLQVVLTVSLGELD
jgi:drug/metabolite transporter superfamily protein YnfA